MRRSLLIALALILAGAAFAKPTTVKGAKCAACHQGNPKDKKWINAKTEEMVKKYKEPECQSCHAWADGKLTVTKK